jgi:hypothetical protein
MVSSEAFLAVLSVDSDENGIAMIANRSAGRSGSRPHWSLSTHLPAPLPDAFPGDASRAFAWELSAQSRVHL